MAAKTESAPSLGRRGFLWVLDEGDPGSEEPRVCYCLNNYAYDSSRGGFLGEGSYFRAYRGRKLFSFNKDSVENVTRTLKVGLISCLKSHKVVLVRGGGQKIVMSVYERVLLEYLILRKLSHYSVPRTFDLLELPETNQMVFIHEYLPFQLMYWNRSARTYSANKDQSIVSVYTEKAAMLILYQILACVDYLHENRIVHKDIKPENIFLTRRVEDSETVLVEDLDTLEEEEEEEEGFFEEVCLWEDAPVFESVSQAKAEQRRLCGERGVGGASTSALEELLELEEYRSYFEGGELAPPAEEPVPGLESDFRVVVKLSDFNSCTIVDDSGLIYDSGKFCLAPPVRGGAGGALLVLVA